MTSNMTLRSLLAQQSSDVALVIGNGINLYGNAHTTNSWSELLVTLAKTSLGSRYKKIPDGISLTEYYDILDLNSETGNSGKSLQSKFCDLMSEWEPHTHHKKIVAWAQQTGSPLLTTNFEKVLAEAGGCSLQHTRLDRFTDYYPWEKYYGTKKLDDPCAGFGIWHINGMEHYKRSIRLGLSHYMGSVEKARNWIHKGKERRLFSGKNVEKWRGAGTWLHIVFSKPLLFIGLALEENEVFLRWLLIERARYFRKFPERKKSAWYIYVDELDDSGKMFFLEGVGVKPVRVSSYDEIYGPTVWSGS